MNSPAKKIKKDITGTTKKILEGVLFVGTWPTRKIEEALDIIYGYNNDSGINPPINTRILSIFISCVIISCIALYFSLHSDHFTRESAYMFSIFILACLLWVTESLPLFATALLIVGLEILLISNPGSWAGLGMETGSSPDFTYFLDPLSDPIIFLFLGGFILAKAAVKRGVDMALASYVIKLFGTHPKRVLLGMMATTAFLSMWMSNTATTTMMLTLALPIAAQIPDELNYQKGLILAIPFAANIGGLGTPIASPPNAVAIGYLNDIDIRILFLEWMSFAIPLVLIMLAIAFRLISKNFKLISQNHQIHLERRALDGKGKYVVFIFMITIGLWITENLHGLPTAVVALIPIIGFTATGLLNKQDINSLEWSILLLIAGGIALGRGMSITGLDKIFASWLPGDSPFIYSILLLGTLLMSTLISNTATANLLIPIGVSMASGILAGDTTFFTKQVAIGIALSSSMAMSLPVSTAPNTIAYAQGKLKTSDFVKIGSTLGILAIIIISLGSWVVQWIYATYW